MWEDWEPWTQALHIPGLQDCAQRGGLRLGLQVGRLSLLIQIWSHVLRLTKWCESISYRARVSSSQDIGNCLLSDIKPEDLRDVGDVVKVSQLKVCFRNNFISILQDSSWNIYSVSFDLNCINGNSQGTVSPLRPSGDPSHAINPPSNTHCTSDCVTWRGWLEQC